MPYPVVARRGAAGAIELVDLSPEPFVLPDLADARARMKSAKNRMVLLEPPAGKPDVARAVREGIGLTLRGLFSPPMKSFGLPALAKWASLAANEKDKKGWPRLFKERWRLPATLKWMVMWIEYGPGSGSAGGHRAFYAEFLERAAPVLGKRALVDVARRYRSLAAEWTGLVDVLLPAEHAPLRRSRALMERQRKLLASSGMTDLAALDGVAAELRAVNAEMRADFPMGDAELGKMFAEVAARVKNIHAGEVAAAEALKAAVS
jgi:hypothetical protein